MAWVAVDKAGFEFIYDSEPIKRDLFESWFPSTTGFVQLPIGTIEKLIDRTLTWDDDSVDIG